MCPSGCDFTTIAAAVTAAVGGDEIEIAAGVVAEENISVTKTLTFRGAGPDQTFLQPPVNTSGLHRIFNIGAGITVVIEDMTMRNGRVSSGNGGTIATSAPLTLRNCVIQDTVASNGGAISTIAALVIEDSVFLRSSGGAGGAIQLLAGASLVASGTTFRENTGGDASCIYTTVPATPIALTDCTLIDNGISTSGPAIYSTSPVTLTRSEVRRNAGGLVAVNVGVTEFTMVDSQVVENLGMGGVQVGGTSTITRSLIQGNGGRGINNQGDLTLVDSTVAGNEDTSAAGIYNSSPSTSARIVNSTIANNLAYTSSTDSDIAGGIYNASGALLQLDNVTITGNQAGYSGGGLFAAGGGVEIRNSVIANNSAGVVSADCHGSLHSLGFNLIEALDGCSIDSDQDNLYGIDPELGALVDNGGPMLTLSPLSGSPLIDGGSCADSEGDTVAFDQRGVARPIGATCDIGAVESAGAPGGGTRFACWDANEDDVCSLPGEDTNQDGDCAPNDCQGQNGVACWDLDANGTCSPQTEDFTNDNACTLLDCRGAAGTNGYSCWDTNQNHVCDPSESVDAVPGCNVADCRGSTGAAGFSCWDSDSDYVCDASENRNADGSCTPLDCVGTAGSDGSAGAACWDLDTDGTCDVATEDASHDGLCNLIDCRGAAGTAGAACWDLNTNAICDPSEDESGDQLCNVLDCQGADGFSCWDLDADYVCDPSEDVNDSDDCTPLDCFGASGIACWDLDASGACEPANEDFTSDGVCTVLDCRGDNDKNGFSCWDRNMNRVCDPSEDFEDDDTCDVLDCQGAPGPQGPTGPQGETGEQGEDGERGDIGATGPDGDDGAMGLPGAQGEPGAKGDDGEPGPEGPAGDDGPSHGDALAEIEDQLPNAQCPAGGKRIDTGFDANGDGSLNREEITDTDYVCNGSNGAAAKGCGCSVPGATSRPPRAIALLSLLALGLALRRRRAVAKAERMRAGV